MFDFFNYNYSALIGIFAALMGMAYPLILQAIQKVDEMYHGTCLATFVQKQWPFRLFSFCLIIAIPTSLIASFALYYLDDFVACIIVSVVHTVIILTLIVSAVLLFKFIMLTTRPMDFQKYLARKCKGKHPPLVELFQMAKFASDTEDLGLYKEAVSDICSKIFEYRKSYSKGKLVKYPSEVWAFLRELHRQHGKKDNHFFSKCDFISALFFTPTDFYPFSNDEYIYLWQSVDAVVGIDNSQWVYSYWTCADQYYRFVIDGDIYSQSEAERVQKERFKQMHFMIGALLVYNDKLKLLKELMFLSNSMPPTYDLVPSSFQCIWKNLFDLIRLSHTPLLLTQRYLMIGAPQDVSSDGFILRQAYRYAALLMIRLYNVNDWNITYGNPLEIPFLNEWNKVEDIKEVINVINRLKVFVTEWYELKDALKFSIGKDVAPQNWVMDLCDKFIAACKKKAKELESTTEVDPQKITYIKEHLIEAVKAYHLTLPLKDSITEDFEKNSLNNTLTCSINSEIIKAGTYTNASNLPDLLIARLNEQLYKGYNFIFLKNSSTKSYRIAYKDIKRTLDSIGVNENFVILLMGVYLGNYEAIYGKNDAEHFVESERGMTYKKCRIYSIPSAMQSIIILKKEDLPVIELCELKNANGWEVLEQENFLYSNINSIKEITEETIDLSIGRGVVLYEPNYHIKYIRMAINYNYDDVTDLRAIADGRKEVWGE